MARGEVETLQKKIEEETKRLQLLLCPKTQMTKRHSEARRYGRNEASLFSGDLFRMYSRFVDKRGWRVEIMSTSEESGGFKEVIANTWTM